MTPVYLDHAATTPLRSEVLEAMLARMGDAYGNPSSAHGWGRRARAALDEARERFAAVIGAAAGEVVFTHGGTEADNLAVLGRAAACPGRPVACSATEHRATLEAARAAGAAGAPLRILPVDANGVVDENSVERALAERPAVLSVMWANNETGTLQPVERLARTCEKAGVAFHSDAVQALGRVSVRVDHVPVSLLAFSAHKVGGPRGVGALFVRRGTELAPLLHGGGQEHGLRPGTENVAGVWGLAVAAELAEAEREAEAGRLAALRDRLEERLRAEVPELVVNGAGAERLPHVSHVSLPGADRELLVTALDMEGIAVSAGSACSSGALRISHVLEAMGVEPEIAAGSVRFSLGRGTGEADVERAASAFAAITARLRAFA